MKTGRQDAWTVEEDSLLAELVLTNIREGSTQLNAFKEAGEKLNRTASACGFRWNSYVRKEYHNEIAQAKKNRKQAHKNGTELADGLEIITCNQKGDIRLSIRDVIHYLNGLQEDQEANIQSYSALKEENHLLRKRVGNLNLQIKKLQNECGQLKTEYLSLITILEKARTLATKENKYKEAHK